MREPSSWPNIAEEVDRLEDQLRERFRLTERQAREVADWHRQQVRDAGTTGDSERLGMAIRILCRPGGDPRARAMGLAFAAGLNRLHGYTTVSEAADAIGCTRANLSKLQVYWREKLGLPHNEHSKSAEAQEAYREVQTANHWRRRTQAETMLVS